MYNYNFCDVYFYEFLIFDFHFFIFIITNNAQLKS